MLQHFYKPNMFILIISIFNKTNYSIEIRQYIPPRVNNILNIFNLVNYQFN